MSSSARDRSEAVPSDGLLLAFYGDDFTGSTDALEALTAAGLPSLLCLEAPDPAWLAKFPGLRCVGMAGSSRGRSVAWMQTELPKAFAALAALGAPILHYKVCSTFDSSTSTGSIGQAIELGVRQMGGHWTPTVVGVPRLGRYQVFGHLFAADRGLVHRLDRHPTMSRHPVTPMRESDLRIHLGQQTHRRLELLDIQALSRGDGDRHLAAWQGKETPVVMMDVLDERSLVEVGRLIWTHRGPGLFSASSSGLCYALTAYWRSAGLMGPAQALPAADTVDAIAAVSGSCSPITAAQIRWARAHGFETTRIDLSAALSSFKRDAEVDRCVRLATEALRQGQSALVYSAEGPDDEAVTGFDAVAQACGLTRETALRAVGLVLGQVMTGILERIVLKRIAIAGGDSSGAVVEALAIQALTVKASLAPGAPLCQAWSRQSNRHGLELVLKGGQMGAESFFGVVRSGLSASGAV